MTAFRSTRYKGAPPINWAAILPELGTMPDVELALKYNVHRTTVSTFRRSQNIPRHAPSHPHGTVKRYRTGCRCEECRRANADKSKNFRVENPRAWRAIDRRRRVRERALRELAAAGVNL